MGPLPPPPPAFADASGAPIRGTFCGVLPAVTLARSRLRTKKWLWLGVEAEGTWTSLALVQTGYASSAFAFVASRDGMIAEHVALGPPWAVTVSDDVRAPSIVRASLPRAEAVVTAASGGWTVDARIGPISLRLDLAVSDAPALSAVAEVAPSRVSATVKCAPVAAEGRIAAGARAWTLRRGLAGFDYTHGHMPRRTRWRWAFALGNADGRAMALNLTNGFVGGHECALLADGAAVRLAEPEITFDPLAFTRPWRVRSEDLDLAFAPVAVHTQRTNLLAVRTRFVQCPGMFRGRLLGRAVELPGVVEDQDVVW